MWIPLLQKYREYVLGWTVLGCLFTMTILGVKYIFVIPIHAKTEARKDIANIVKTGLMFGIGIMFFTAGVVTQMAKVGLNTHAPAINLAMHMDARAKIHPVVTKRKFESSENVNEYIDNGNSRELKEDGQQRTSGMNDDLDVIDHTDLN